jgi:plastocyanin
MRLNLFMVLGLLLALSPSQAFGPPFTIVMEGEAPYFFPSKAVVPPGVPIQWKNPTATYHTATHDGCIVEGPCLFDSGSVAPNGTYSVPHLPPGRYPYHCQVHPIMRGMLTVIESSAPPSTTL